MVEVRVENVTKKFGEVEAIHDLTFKVKDKEMFCLLGYPGAGKTTTLKTIAGLEMPDQGHIYIDEEQVDHIYPGDRDIAMVFQNLALYSNKTIFENLASPLKVRKTPKDEIKRKVLEIARTPCLESISSYFKWWREAESSYWEGIN
jgi:multiple sugar transport system ATP-binding protein